MWLWCESSHHATVYQLHNWFILLNYFQKYLYLSTSKTTAFYFYLSPFFGQCFVLYFNYFFVQVTKLLLDYLFEYFLHHCLCTFCRFRKFLARLKTKCTIFVVAQKRNMLPFSMKLKCCHSFALFLATRDTYQAQLSLRKVFTFCERVLLQNKLHNTSYWQWSIEVLTTKSWETEINRLRGLNPEPSDVESGVPVPQRSVSRLLGPIPFMYTLHQWNFWQ